MRRLIFYLIWIVGILYLIWVLPSIYLYSETTLFSGEYGFSLSEDTINILKDTLGYNKSFAEGIKDFFTFRWGHSILYGGEDVYDIVVKHILATLVVLVPTYVIAFLVGIAVALIDVRMGRKVPFVSLAFLHSVPVFLWAFLLYGLLSRYLSPLWGVALSLFISEMSSFYLAIRSVLITENAYRYMLYAEAYGIGGLRLYMRGLKPSLPHILQVFASKFPHVLGGVPFVEIVWTYPGIGYLTFRAIVSGDLALIRGAVMAVSVISLVAVMLSRTYKDVRHYA